MANIKFKVQNLTFMFLDFFAVMIVGDFDLVLWNFGVTAMIVGPWSRSAFAKPIGHAAKCIRGHLTKENNKN